MFMCSLPTVVLAQARNAISQLTDTELMGRPILVREDRGDGSSLGRGVGGGAGAKVFVGNLSWQVVWQDLKDHMRQASFHSDGRGCRCRGRNGIFRTCYLLVL